MKSFQSKSHSTFSIHYSTPDQSSDAVESLLEVETAIAANSTDAAIYDSRIGLLQKFDPTKTSSPPPAVFSVVGMMAFCEESKKRKDYYDSAILQYYLIVEENQRQQNEKILADQQLQQLPTHHNKR